MRKHYLIPGLALFLEGCHPLPHEPLPLPQLRLPTEKPARPHAQVPTPFEAIPPIFLKKVSFSKEKDLSWADLKALCHLHGITLILHEEWDAPLPCVPYSFSQEPLISVMENLCEGSGFRCRAVGRTLHLEKDTPYLQTHIVPFPLGSRQTQNQVHVLTDVLSALEGTSASHNSHTSLSTKVMVDFWGELEQTLLLILDPLSQPPPAPRQSSVTVPPSSPSTPSARRTVRLLSAPPPKGSGPFEAKLVSSSPSAAATPPPAREAEPRRRPYALHKQAGLVVVHGTKRQHRLIHHYLTRLKQMTHLQVTIEAQILEVFLKEQYKRGIDWQLLGHHLEGRFLAKPHFDSSLLALTLKGGNVASVLALMEEFGSVRTLSNPRLTVLNNQPALMKVAKNEVFFRLEVDRVLSSDNKPDIETTTSRMQTIPIGLVLLVQPSVDPDTQEITLALRPTLSRVVEMRDDPAVSIRSDNKIHSYVPVVQMRELDSVLKVRSHDTVLMGGLMETSREEGHRGIPFLQETPFLGGVLSSREETSRLSELIILLTVWLEEEGGTAAPLKG